MAELLLSMNLIKQSEEDEIKWILPDEELDYELVEWHIMEKCLGRIDMLETDYNCMDKSSDIFDSNSCNAKGKQASNFLDYDTKHRNLMVYNLNLRMYLDGEQVFLLSRSH